MQWGGVGGSVGREAAALPRLCGPRLGSPGLQLSEFLLELPELASTPVHTGLEGGYVRSQLQAVSEAGLGLPQTVRDQDAKPVQRVLGGGGCLWLWGPRETLAPT